MNTHVNPSQSGPGGPSTLAPEPGVLYDLQFDCPVCGVLRPVALDLMSSGVTAHCAACGEQVPEVRPVEAHDPDRDKHPYGGLG
ncbi:MAG: hypothetical protein JNJ45_05465 [Chthonomonas sp.]|nr:hypothetical protein [Chthonomonas sp.]